MKKIFILGVFLLSFSLQAAISILSDLDDTIKITGSGGASEILGDGVFTGMPEFLTSAKSYTEELHILSASPSILRSKITKVLKKNKIQYNSLILRRNVLEGKFEYKVRAIKKILDASSDDFILIGDDVGLDPEVYVEIQNQYPERILASYIHIVKGRQIPSNVVSYWTSFDLALREFNSGRMESVEVEALANRLISDEKTKLVFPIKAQCPTAATVWEWQLSTTFQVQANELINKYIQFCQQRQSGTFSK